MCLEVTLQEGSARSEYVIRNTKKREPIATPFRETCSWSLHDDVWRVRRVRRVRGAKRRCFAPARAGFVRVGARLRGAPGERVVRTCGTCGGVLPSRTTHCDGIHRGEMPACDGCRCELAALRAQRVIADVPHARLERSHVRKRVASWRMSPICVTFDLRAARPAPCGVPSLSTLFCVDSVHGEICPHSSIVNVRGAGDDG